MASFGRRIDRVGLKVIAIFPYAFVDTSEAWFEPRRRRIAVSAAGPVADFSLGAVFSLCALLLPEGTVRDIFFNLAFAAYVGGFFNLNPFIERDGYHMLVDWLDEPGLRRRAKVQLERRLGGKGAPTDSPVLMRYSLWGIGWSVLAACFAIAMSLRYEQTFLDVDGRPSGRIRGHGHALGRILPAGDLRAGQAAVEPDPGRLMAHLSEADLAAQVIERLLMDPAFRARFRRDPAGACREAGLDRLAQEMSIGAGKAFHTLDMRESRSSLAGVMMAAAMEGVGIYQFTENVLPHLEELPAKVADVVSRVDLPAIKLPGLGGGDAVKASDGGGATAVEPPELPGGAAAAGGGRWRAAAPPPAARPRRRRRPRRRGGGRSKADAPAPPPGGQGGRSGGRARQGQGGGREDRGGGLARGEAGRGGRGGRGRARAAGRGTGDLGRCRPRRRGTRPGCRKRPRRPTARRRACPRRPPARPGCRKRPGGRPGRRGAPPEPPDAPPTRRRRRRRSIAGGEAAAGAARAARRRRPRRRTGCRRAAPAAEHRAAAVAPAGPTLPRVLRRPASRSTRRSLGAEGTGGEPSPETSALLKNDKLVLDNAGMAALKEGRVDPRVVAVLTKLSQEHKITVTAIGGRGGGRGVDIGAIDGEVVSPDSPLARDVASELSSLNPRCARTRSPRRSRSAGRATSPTRAHQDHLRIGFKEAIAPDWKPPAEVADDGGAAGAPAPPVAAGAAVRRAPVARRAGRRRALAASGPPVAAAARRAGARFADAPGGAEGVGRPRPVARPASRSCSSRRSSRRRPVASAASVQPAGGAQVAVDLAAVAAAAPDAYPGDNAPREQIAAWMAGQAEKRGLPPELPLMASLVESGMKNLNFGDADSVGFFQMRVSIWDSGAYKGYADKPELQVKWFLDEAEKVKNARVAAGKPIDDPNSYGEWIADTERPAEQYRGRYQTKLEEAKALLEQPVGAPAQQPVAAVPVVRRPSSAGRRVGGRRREPARHRRAEASPRASSA